MSGFGLIREYDEEARQGLRRVTDHLESLLPEDAELPATVPEDEDLEGDAPGFTTPARGPPRYTTPYKPPRKGVKRPPTRPSSPSSDSDVEQDEQPNVLRYLDQWHMADKDKVVLLRSAASMLERAGKATRKAPADDYEY